jgi:hypothetical protein
MVRRRGLAALFPAKYQIIQTMGNTKQKAGSIKKAKEQIDKEKNAQNNLEDKA